MGFDDDTAVRALGDGAYRGNVDPTWWTQRGPLGGYVMAIGLRAMQEAVGDGARQPRSLTMHFLRPPGQGELLVRPVVERAGRALTTVSARVEQGDKTVALALAAFSRPWPGETLAEATMPDGIEPPDRDGPSTGLVRGADPPPFVARLLMQGRFGDPAFSGAARGEVGGWLGLREPREVDALVVTLLADAWFPAPWPRLSGFAPSPTIDLTVHFRAPLPLPAAASPLLGRFRSRLVRDGFFEEDGELWAPDGTLVAQSRQLGLLLDPPG